ncbi:PREDICTED: uncharacterized protein LOC109189836 [Ipomoea nil]|uniref:uncharacterized protein LOC109189836 n=1 Tax=Ipomoea nil TaxID=35883 RepID=UPI000901CA4A|nr:PREDICTED: uncharacterized protein LOC109189836 [Ipomoea nil]
MAGDGGRGWAKRTASSGGSRRSKRTARSPAASRPAKKANDGPLQACSSGGFIDDDDFVDPPPIHVYPVLQEPIVDAPEGDSADSVQPEAVIDAPEVVGDAPEADRLDPVDDEPVVAAPQSKCTSEESLRFPSAKIRVPLVQLVEALADLTSLQKKDIRDLGFGSLLELKIKEMPLRLGRWLLLNFDPQARSIRLGEGEFLEVREEDVAAIMGFPCGEVVVTRRARHAKSKLLTAWRGTFEKDRYDVKPMEVAQWIRDDLEGGDWFKRHFMVLVISSLISCMNNGYCNQMVFHHLDDVSAIGSLNWCRFVIEELLSTHALWRVANDHRFTGPIFFLIVRHGPRVVPRAIPAFRGWTSKFLRERELSEIRAGGFGVGELEPVQGVDADVVHDQAAHRDDPGVEAPVNLGGSPGPSMPPGCLRKSLVERYAHEIGVISRSILTLVELGREAAVCSAPDANLFQLVEVGQMLTGVKPQPSIPLDSDGTASQPTLSLFDDDFWANADNVRELAEVERALMARLLLNHMPSFSLGLTQEFGGGAVDSGADIAMGINQQSSGLGVGVDPPGQVSRPLGVVGAVPVVVDHGDHVPVASLAQGSDEGAPGHSDVVAGSAGHVFDTPAEQVVPCRDSSPVCVAPLKAVRPVRPVPDSIRAADLYGDVPLPSVDVVDDGVISKWVLECGNDALHEVLFSHGGCVVRRGDLRSLAPGSAVSVAVLDAWSVIFNYREFGKSPGAPSRVFASASSTLFLPVMQSNLFYVVCVDFVNEHIEIIDSSASTEATSKKYGDTPDNLQLLLFEFFKAAGLGYKQGLCFHLVPKRMQMKWRDSRNKVDSGVYAMRHMESYAGEGVSRWECGLVKGDVAGLERLRFQYLKAICVADINANRASNVANAVRYVSGGGSRAVV